MQRDRINLVFKDMSISDLLGAVQLKGYSEEGYVRLVYTPHFSNYRLTKDEMKTITKWVDEDYVEWYRLWQAPKNRDDLTDRIIEIGTYYQNYIQGLFGMAPDLLREDAHTIMGRVAGLVVERLDRRLSEKDLFKLLIISNTYLPDMLAEPFRTGLWLGTVTSEPKYAIAYQSLLQQTNFNYMGLNIFGFVTKVINEGVKDSTWLDGLFNTQSFKQRTINYDKAKDTISAYIHAHGYDEDEYSRVEQLLQGYEILAKNQPEFRRISLSKLDNNTVKFHFVDKKDTAVIVTFGKRRVVAFEKSGKKLVVLNEPSYDCSLKKMGETIMRAKTVLGAEAVMVGLMVSKSTHKTQRVA